MLIVNPLGSWKYDNAIIINDNNSQNTCFMR